MAAKRFTNLLPQEEQKEISFDRISRRLLNFFLLVFGSLLLVAVLFFAGRLYLNGKIESLKSEVEYERSQASKEDNVKLKQKLNALNIHLNNLASLGEHHAVWSEVLIAFARLVPSDVTIDSFNAVRETGLVKIIGFAKTRESVLSLRNNLLASSYFRDVDFPLSNLNRATDVSFRYSFYINTEELIKSKEYKP